MLIELSQLPPVVQEQILSEAGNTLQIANNGQIIKHYTAKDDEQAYYEWFYEHHFDIERLQKAIGETDENGRAKNAREVPDWALSDLASFDRWLASV